ncbi:MAG TPA: hypothetical protein VI488_17210 [Candidatus Angelobacter sp.]
MITMIVIALALSALALFYVAVRNRRKQSVQAIRAVDLKAFRTLTERDDELFLRERLPQSRFRRLKRQRIRVAMSYVGRIAGNAAVVMRMGEEARLSPNPEVAQAAAHVTELATQIRMQCMVAFAKLSAEFALPSLQLTPATLAPAYQTLRENVMLLGSLKLNSAAPVAVAI